MALHRDIFWIGRQWAVTGHGMQLIDQKLQGFFDVAIAHLWDDALIETMHGKQWLNAADFDKGLAVARTRFPQSPDLVTRQPANAPAVVVKPDAPLPPVAKTAAPKPEPPKINKPEPPARAAPLLRAPEPARPDTALPPATPPELQMRIEGHARLVRPWRVWMKGPS